MANTFSPFGFRSFGRRDGGAPTAGLEALTLNGTGVTSNGALRNVSGANTYGGAITLASASEIQSDAGTLSLTNTITNGGFLLTVDANTGAVNASGVISGMAVFIRRVINSPFFGALSCFFFAYDCSDLKAASKFFLEEASTLWVITTVLVCFACAMYVIFLVGQI